jgi:O-methyltransferase
MSIKPDHAYAANLHAFRKRLLENLASIELSTLKEGFPHEQIIPKATYAPWKADLLFMQLYEKVRHNTLIDIYRLYELYELAGSLGSVGGDFLEVGVWRGGSAALIGNRALSFPEAKIWLADTFTGVPAPVSLNDTIYQGGEHADTSIEDVQEILRNCGVSEYKILKGLFPAETAHLICDKIFRFAHIDVDSYDSAMNVFNWVWPRISQGGLVIFDDYGFWGCEGVAMFVNELKQNGLQVIHNLNGHAILWKLNSSL